MDRAWLAQLGLELRDGAEGPEATCVLAEPLENPVGHREVSRVVFLVREGRLLVPISPPEVMGLRPIALGAVEGRGDVESELADAFHEHLFHVQRRSAELRALGLSPRVDPVSMGLSTHLSEQGLALTLVADRQGNFQVSSAVRGGQTLVVPPGHGFELSEFRERGALVGYLAALFGEPEAGRARDEGAEEGVLRFSDVLRAFGERALVPPRSGMELLVVLEVEGRPYRFAAARVSGRTFRGLLAGTQGKVWAERFQLDEFPGVIPLVASLLKVPPGAVKLAASDTPQE
ncbi:hypothetical protein [Melittangium boletus]|uniref:Uncharacterized protein n=1 Tax=Melittangium boletus DSM 14713 TaxID=1294270 RepID=A0A250IR77_9BACT|nr:hypothetical protein [Melittangium boletus]ATB33687.1 hypothetical protein MEBOL_007185 [Melittangium boletus DSM 14713]